MVRRATVEAPAKLRVKTFQYDPVEIQAGTSRARAEIGAREKIKKRYAIKRVRVATGQVWRGMVAKSLWTLRVLPVR